MASPTGETPLGFERGFQAHPELPSFADSGDLVYLAETKGALDKRKGNRWLVIDAELRPLLEQHFVWWERTVKRNPDGKPLTTKLWITATGVALRMHRLETARREDVGMKRRRQSEDDVLDPDLPSRLRGLAFRGSRKRCEWREGVEGVALLERFRVALAGSARGTEALAAATLVVAGALPHRAGENDRRKKARVVTLL